MLWQERTPSITRSRSYKTKTQGLLEYYKSRQPFPGSRARRDAFVLFGEVSLIEILTSYYVFEN